MAIERIISVTFKHDASKDVISQFFKGIENLSQLFREEVEMTMHCSILRDHEHSLSNAVDTSNYADCISIWKFKDEGSLIKFLNDGRHKKIASEHFKSAVATRTVINIHK